MAIIKLTRTTYVSREDSTVAYKESPYYIPVDNIAAFYSKRNETFLEPKIGTMNFFIVKETPEEIMQLIKEAEREN